MTQSKCAKMLFGQFMVCGLKKVHQSSTNFNITNKSNAVIDLWGECLLSFWF